MSGSRSLDDMSGLETSGHASAALQVKATPNKSTFESKSPVRNAHTSLFQCELEFNGICFWLMCCERGGCSVCVLFPEPERTGALLWERIWLVWSELQRFRLNHLLVGVLTKLDTSSPQYHFIYLLLMTCHSNYKSHKALQHLPSSEELRARMVLLVLLYFHFWKICWSSFIFKTFSFRLKVLLKNNTIIVKCNCLLEKNDGSLFTVKFKW